MGAVLFGIIVVGLSTALAVVGFLVVRRRVNPSELMQHHDVADPLLSVIGTLYAVLLGFLVADAMTKYQAARATVDAEANSLADVFRLAGGLPPSLGEKVHKLCIDYSDAVIAEEWNAMENGMASPKAWESMRKMWNAVLAYEPDGDRQTTIYAQLVDELSQLGDARRTRLVTARTKLPAALWVVLMAGAVSTIVFTYFFGTKNKRAQIVMTMLVSVCLSLNIFLLLVYNSPFVGDLKVPPDAFSIERELFRWHRLHPAGEGEGESSFAELNKRR